jgi:Flp pilus assembly protein TadG
VRRDRARGLAMVEFVISVPILIFLLFVIAELGRVFVQYTVLANSVRNATRYAINQVLDTSGLVFISTELREQTQRMAVYGNPNGTGSPRLPSYRTSQISVTSDASGNIEVTANYAYQPLLSGGTPGVLRLPLTSAFNMQVAVTMRVL